MTLKKWIMKATAAVKRPSVRKDNTFTTNAVASFCMNEVPSNRLVIQIGLTLSIKSAANPNVQTTIKDDFLFSISSSLYVMAKHYKS